MSKLKKHLLNILILIATALSVGTVNCGCTRNNGDIGLLFGQWQVTEMTVNGQADTAYTGNIFWSFQNNIIYLQQVMPDDPTQTNVNICWGTWKEEDNTLILDFSHHDNDHPTGTNIYKPFDILHIPAEDNIRMAIISTSGNRMILTYTANNENVYNYTIVKR